MSKSPPSQPSLFDKPAATDTHPAQVLVAIPTPAAAQSKAQGAFNRLVEQIQQQRELLQQWQQYEVRYHQRLAGELQPLQARLREAQRGLLVLLDALLSDAQPAPRLSKAQRRKLAACIPQLAGLLLQEEPNAEVEALFDRYSDVSHADLLQADLAEAEAMFGHLLGEDLIEGHQAQSMDELMQHAARNMAAQAQAHAAQQTTQQAARAERLAQQPQTAKGRQAEAARQRKEAAAQQAAQQAGQSVREVFRKLASALHPDRETDLAERERKTALMQQANQAYERNDLLSLLTLQLQIEQIDAQHLAGLPEARLLHYNQVLREQLQALRQEVQACAQPFLMQLGPGLRQPGPAAVDAALTLDIQQLGRCLVMVDLDVRNLRDPALRRAAIDNLELPDDDDDGPDEFEAMMLMEALATAPAMPGRRKRRR